jgi:hypothetical protein
VKKESGSHASLADKTSLGIHDKFKVQWVGGDGGIGEGLVVGRKDWATGFRLQLLVLVPSFRWLTRGAVGCVGTCGLLVIVCTSTEYEYERENH